MGSAAQFAGVTGSECQLYVLGLRAVSPYYTGLDS